MTGETHALKALFGENSSGSASYKLAVATVCSRLAGVFASLKVCRLQANRLLKGCFGGPTLGESPGSCSVGRRETFA